MMQFLLFSCLVALAAAQDYACSPPEYCDSQQYDREPRTGCTYFCYLGGLDGNPDNDLSRADFNEAFADWSQGAAEVTRERYVEANLAALWLACETELNASFDRISQFDGEGSTVSLQDIDVWYQQVLAASGAAGPDVRNVDFAAWWSPYYAEVSDENCPYPW